MALESVVQSIKNLSPAEQVLLLKLMSSHPLKKNPYVWLIIGVVIGAVYIGATFEFRYYCIRKSKLSKK